MTISILGTLLGILFLVLLTSMLFHYLRLPTLLGYLIVGAVVGPHAFGLIANEEIIKTLAELGIVLLMFTIGLDISLRRLVALRYWVLGVGGLQVAISILVTSGIGIVIGLTPLAAFAVGGIVAMSSTAIVMREFVSHKEFHPKIKNNAIAILLAQDIAVIPIFILLASFSAYTDANPLKDLILALVNGFLAFGLILLSRRWILNPIFRIVSSTKAVELFTLLVLLVSLSTAWLTHWLGLSYALGAFLAGVMLSETEFRHQI